MSRVGNVPISIPEGVNVLQEGHQVVVTGPLGSLKREIDPRLKVEIADREVFIKRKKDDWTSKSLHGLSRTLVANMISGVKQGWEKKLELVGVGFRAQVSGDKIILQVGYSHPVEKTAPEGIKFSVEDNTKITIWGIDKDLVGQVAATLRKIRPPEVYKGKGIRYSGEYIRKKAGKAGKVGAEATK